jgi:hypothetical protein
MGKKVPLDDVELYFVIHDCQAYTITGSRSRSKQQELGVSSYYIVAYVVLVCRMLL